MITSGPDNAKILIVGEYPSPTDLQYRKPFMGSSGTEFSKMLHEAGLIRAECKIIFAIERPPLNGKEEEFFPKPTRLKGGEQHVNGKICAPVVLQGLMRLKAELTRFKPTVIITLGEIGLWAVTGESGIGKWRGSMIQKENGTWIIPTYSPEQIMRVWQWRFIAVQDLRRAVGQLQSPVSEPSYSFTVSPSFDQVQTRLNEIETKLQAIPVPLAVDIETRKGYMDCIGIGESHTHAICIPFCSMESDAHYWSLEEEFWIVQKLKTIFLHPNARIVFQNGLYDAMYMAKHWGWYPVPYMDTMIAHAVCFAGLPKGLDFLSSLYLPYHRYWKDENKEANEKLSDEQRWIYNCKDCVVTFALVSHLQDAIKDSNVTEPYKFEMSLFNPLMRTMMRGIRIDQEKKSKFALELLDAQSQCEQYFHECTHGVWDDIPLVKTKGAKPWFNSPIQQQKIFYQIFKLPVVRNRATGRPSADDEALKKIQEREPLFIPLTNKLLEYRSIGVFYSTFIMSRIDKDGRIRTSYNPVGTTTFRFNSKIDAFGQGMNLQNIPSGGEK